MDSDDVDLREHLARSFGDGPSHRPLDERLAAGRRALLRRRLGTGAAAAAVVAVLGTSYAVTAGGHDRAVHPAPVVTPTPVPTPSTDAGPSAESKPVRLPWGRQFVRYSADLRLEVRPGATVVTRIRNPAGVEPPAVSDALTVRWKGTDYWVLANADPSTSGLASIPAAPGGTSNDLRAWADTMIANDLAAQQGGTDDPAADFPGVDVAFDDTGRLVADEGHRIVEQQQDVDLGASFAPVGATTALALVAGGGERTWWLGRVVDGVPDYVPYAAAPGQTAEEFLTFARDRYRSGEGLR